MRIVIILQFILCLLYVSAQPNCEAYKYYGDELKYKACKVAEKRKGHYQFSRRYQEALDDALAIDSTFAYAYRVKSTAYLKSGDFITWKKLIDQAVKYEPESELFYRASCRYQFFRDFKGAIEDIERLDSLIDYDIGYSQNGDYHLNIIKAISYRELGNLRKSYEIFEEQLNDSTHMVGSYDYLHFGALCMRLGETEKAMELFKKQESVNDIAENRYYMAQALEEVNEMEASRANLISAKEKYLKGSRMFDRYVEKLDQIYLLDIVDKLESMDNKQ